MIDRIHFIPGPSGAPQNLNSTSTSVTISWNNVKCVHRNGLITHYTITYSPMDSTDQITDRVNITDPNNGGSYTVSGLQPSTNYVFRIAAVNDAGVGVFATVLTNVFTTVFTTVSTDNTTNSSGNLLHDHLPLLIKPWHFCICTPDINLCMQVNRVQIIPLLQLQSVSVVVLLIVSL